MYVVRKGKNKKSIKVRPLAWTNYLIEKIKKHQDELRQRKIEYLRQRTYEYFLTQVVASTIKSGEVDLFPAIYYSELAVNEKAMSLTNDAVAAICRQGEQRIDSAFTKCRKFYSRGF